MCDTSEEKMIASWNTVVPKILKLEGSLVPDSFNEEVMYTVIKFMDKKFRSSGPTATAPGVFCIHEVSNHIIM